MAKICCGCLEEKPLEEFSFKNIAKGIRQSYCRVCKSGYSKRYYIKNADAVKAKTSSRNARVEVENRERIYAYLSSHPCVDCDESDPVVLEFDHVRGQKKYDVSLMRTLSWDTILVEIAKCDVRCANCHRKRHARDDGHYRYRGAMI